ncbi:uncharacterized protein BDZ99DRAFT_572009 [Mytilinidion resinicola]|uniref:SprT-like domain-containing protein n=1 Tax=Mytilinidion resinicola TaxID=574789 RepID=A0A6A6YK40_9PEZI|nr:uncharacterized protein BDZ99DRAFT_572009 [Mytilinidion resinicola]KAF2809222.1 hypothetical protein BDZ99DRAFT_572009 [Mytilinidion resinicola]
MYAHSVTRVTRPGHAPVSWKNYRMDDGSYSSEYDGNFRTTYPLRPRIGRTPPFYPDGPYLGMSPNPRRPAQPFLHPPGVMPRKKGPPSPLENPNLEYKFTSKWNIDYATVFLINRLGKDKDLANGISKVREKSRRYDRREIPYRSFDSLNDTLFAGRLKDAIYLKWVDLGPHVSGTTCNAGEGPDHRVSRITLLLNSTLHQDAHPDEILASLIHHMIHCYFIVTCGPQLSDETKYGRLSHGMHFGKIMSTIKDLSGSTGRRPLPLDFGHNLAQDRDYQYDKPTTVLSPRNLSLLHSQMEPRNQRSPTRSFCPPHPKAHLPTQAEVDEWYTKTCQPLPTLPKCVRGQNLYTLVLPGSEFREFPRAKAPPSQEYVELIYAEKCVYIPATSISTYPSLAGKFEKARWLEIPDDTSLESFKTLYEFLLRGRFSPDQPPDHDSAYHHSHSPPLIRSPIATAEPYLTTSIKALKLAAALKFTELESHALHRLNALSHTHEDPLAILSEIYTDSPDPHPDLRAWARAFLLRREPEHPVMAYLDLATDAGPPANLEVLERDRGMQEKFEHLLEHGGAFHADVSTARTALERVRERDGFPWQAGRMHPHPFDIPIPPPPPPRPMDDWDLPPPPPPPPPMHPLHPMHASYPSSLPHPLHGGYPPPPLPLFDPFPHHEFGSSQREREARLVALGWGPVEREADGWWRRRNRMTGQVAVSRGEGGEWFLRGS